MLTNYKTTPEGLKNISNVTNGCWVNAIGPTQEEITQLENWGIEPDLSHDLSQFQQSQRGHESPGDAHHCG